MPRRGRPTGEEKDPSHHNRRGGLNVTSDDSEGTPRRIYCAKCKKDWTTSDQTTEEEWTCQNCRRLHVGVKFMNLIKQKIQATLTEKDDKYRFVFRELVQNADDVGAHILVARFASDALWVANDGKEFSTAEDGHFARLADVLGRRQEDDPSTTGNFGSGFQTVYSLTNFPVVYSGGWALRIDPTETDEGKRSQKAETNVRSPYAPKGVLFRLAWRDDAAAEVECGEAGRCFSDVNFWPRWNNEERRQLFENLVGYAHHLLLCCQNLECIRLLWEDGDGPRSYQVRRNFTCTPAKASFAENETKVGRVVESQGVGGWRLDEWAPDGENRAYEYLVGHRLACDDEGGLLRIIRGRNRKVRILSEKPGIGGWLSSDEVLN